MPRAEDRIFQILVVLVTIGLLLILQPFFGAILWAFVAALMFEPVARHVERSVGGRHSLAASLTLTIIVVVIVAPAILLALAIFDEVGGLFVQLRSGHIDPAQIANHLHSLLPRWVERLARDYGFDDFNAIRDWLTGALASTAQFAAGQALSVSQSAFGFVLALGVTLYLTFFFLRDGDAIAARIEGAIPLEPTLRRALLDRIVTVIRATIKGSFVVAFLQGLAGGIIFWALGIGGALLWGIAMGLFSLLPAIGTGIIWVPVVLYLLFTGAVVKGAILTFCGLFVIGLIDNLVRPILVGRDTELPDYVVFLSTLGGISLFGFNGFVIGPVIASLFLAVWDIYGAARGEESVTPPPDPQ